MRSLDAFLSRNAKALAALLIGVVGWWGDVIGGPSAISATEWRNLGVVVLTALGVYGATNVTRAAARRSVDDLLPGRPVDLNVGGLVSPPAPVVAAKPEPPKPAPRRPRRTSTAK